MQEPLQPIDYFFCLCPTMFSCWIYFAAIAATTGQAFTFPANEKQQNSSDATLISDINIISQYW